MSAQLEQFVVNTADTARQGVDGARRATGASTAFSRIRRGAVISESDGAYIVAILGNDGTTVDAIGGVRGWGDAVFAAGDKVFLVWVDNRPIPFILSSGGTGGSSDVPVIVGTLGFVG